MVFSKTQLGHYADVMVWAMEEARRGGKFAKYDTVLLRYDVAAAPLAHALYERLLRARYHAVARVNAPEDFARSLYTLADDKQLDFIAAGEKEFQGSVNGLISLRAPEDLTALKNVNPARIARAAVARKSLREIWDRSEQGGCRADGQGLLFK